MGPIFAVIFACLLLHACNSASDTPMASIAINEHSTLREYILAVSDGLDEEYTPPVTVSAVKPIDGAEFGNDDAFTGAVTEPDAPATEMDLSDDEGGWDFIAAGQNRYYLVD